MLFKTEVKEIVGSKESNEMEMKRLDRILGFDIDMFGYDMDLYHNFMIKGNGLVGQTDLSFKEIVDKTRILSSILSNRKDKIMKLNHNNELGNDNLISIEYICEYIFGMKKNTRRVFRCMLPHAGYKILNSELHKIGLRIINKQVFHDDKGYFLKLEIFE